MESNLISKVLKSITILFSPLTRFPLKYSHGNLELKIKLLVQNVLLVRCILVCVVFTRTLLGPGTHKVLEDKVSGNRNFR